MKYPRHLQPGVELALSDTPVVCILGPRQSGKTTLVRKLDPKRKYLSLDDPDVASAAKEDPIGFISGLPRQVTLDEIQKAPELIPAIKLSVDDDRKAGRFLLTGSANLLLLPQVSESLAGRMEILKLHPLTEAEKQRDPGNLLSELLDGRIKTEIVGQRPDPEALREAVISGGYPEPLTRSDARARAWHQQYLDVIIERDVGDVAEVRDTREFAALFELLAQRTASLLNNSNLASDIGLSRVTTNRYLQILERLFLVRRLPAWHTNRSRRLVKSPKLHVVDTGLASAQVQMTRSSWKSESIMAGALIESFVVQQLIATAGWNNPELRFSHYRDKDQVEVDIVIERGQDVWGVEIKKGPRVTNSDAKGLHRLSELAGKDFRGGLLFYGGGNTLNLPVKGCFAIPYSKLWSQG